MTVVAADRRCHGRWMSLFTSTSLFPVRANVESHLQRDSQSAAGERVRHAEALPPWAGTTCSRGPSSHTSGLTGGTSGVTCLAVDGPFLADTRSLSTAAHSPKRHYPDTRSMRWAPTAPWTAQRAECRWPTRLRSTRACERPPWLAAGRHSRSCRQRAAGLARGGRRTRKRETREHPGCDPSSILGPGPTVRPHSCWS